MASVLPQISRGSVRQKGIALLMALIALVILTLSGLALVRSVDTGLVISGNLSFKQITTNAGDIGTETAIQWLSGNAGSTVLFGPSTADGYYANSMQSCDLPGYVTPADTSDDVDWDGSNPGNVNCNAKAKAVPAAALPVGFTAAYVIHRLCSQDGDPGAAGNVCNAFVDETTSAAGSTQTGANYGSLPLSSSSQYYYRITTRVMGPRNTVSYVQAVVLL